MQDRTVLYVVRKLIFAPRSELTAGLRLRFFL